MRISIRTIGNGYIVQFTKVPEIVNDEYHVNSFDEAMELITLAGPDIDTENIAKYIKKLEKQRR